MNRPIERINTLSKLLFLALTPVFFQWMSFAFIFHSIFQGAVTMVVLVWGGFFIASFLFGRIGCGWFCPFGTVMDLTSPFGLRKPESVRPRWVPRVMLLLGFFGGTFAAYFARHAAGAAGAWRFSPFFLPAVFDQHYKLVWVLDVAGVALLGLIFGRRVGCNSVCFMGTLCAVGSRFSRLLAVVDTGACTRCGVCEKSCAHKVPILEYVERRGGLITDTECMKCGRCSDVCGRKAVRFRMVWNRKPYYSSAPAPRPPLQGSAPPRRERSPASPRRRGP